MIRQITQIIRGTLEIAQDILAPRSVRIEVKYSVFDKILRLEIFVPKTQFPFNVPLFWLGLHPFEKKILSSFAIEEENKHLTASLNNKSDYNKRTRAVLEKIAKYILEERIGENVSYNPREEYAATIGIPITSEEAGVL